LLVDRAAHSGDELMHVKREGKRLRH
jgi:hypothetical protein